MILYIFLLSKTLKNHISPGKRGKLSILQFNIKYDKWNPNKDIPVTYGEIVTELETVNINNIALSHISIYWFS